MPKNFKPVRTAAYAAGIFGAVSGALALYIAKRPDLRKELGKSETPADAMKAFGEHMQEDGSKFVQHLRKFLKRTRATRSVQRAGKKATKAAKQAQQRIEEAAERGEEAVAALTDRV
jgi:hypothetical protein